MDPFKLIYPPVDSKSEEYIMAQVEMTPAIIKKVDNPTPINNIFISIGLNWFEFYEGLPENQNVLQDNVYLNVFLCSVS